MFKNLKSFRITKNYSKEPKGSKNGSKDSFSSLVYAVGVMKSYIVLLFVCIYSVYKTCFQSGPHGRPPIGE